MKLRFLFYGALICLLAGIILLSVGLFAMSDITPLGQMDCGCEQRTRCITKLAFLDRGMILGISGGLLMLGTTLFSGAGLYRLSLYRG